MLKSLTCTLGAGTSYEPDPIADEVLASEIASVLHMMQTGAAFRASGKTVRERWDQCNTMAVCSSSCLWSSVASSDSKQ